MTEKFLDITPPESAAKVLSALEAAGYEAYLVGGCVRDALTGRVPHDWDITTSATPAEMLACVDFPHYDAGMAHGTVAFVVDGEAVEATAYRVDGTYSDGRHPDGVSFTRSLAEDLSRRDFTVNAMAYSPSRGLEDPFGGTEDLAAGILRCVGDAGRRFSEDALRIMRALRFCSVYGFEPDGEMRATANAMAGDLAKISRERISSELAKTMAAPDGEHLAAMLDAFRPVVLEVIPALAETVGYDQHNRHHDRDLWEHTLAVVAALPADFRLRLAGLLHDIGKPQTRSFDGEGQAHYYGHMEAGAGMAREILEGLRFDGATIDEVCFLIARHDWRPSPSTKSMRKFLARCGSAGRAESLLSLMEADAAAHVPETAQANLANLERCREVMESELASDALFSMKDMDFSGRDLLAMGWASGPGLGAELKRLYGMVVEGQLPNEREAIAAEARNPESRR